MLSPLLLLFASERYLFSYACHVIKWNVVLLRYLHKLGSRCTFRKLRVESRCGGFKYFVGGKKSFVLNRDCFFAKLICTSGYFCVLVACCINGVAGS